MSPYKLFWIGVLVGLAGGACSASWLCLVLLAREVAHGR
jgi:hypothetical protein